MVAEAKVALIAEQAPTTTRARQPLAWTPFSASIIPRDPFTDDWLSPAPAQSALRAVPASSCRPHRYDPSSRALTRSDLLTSPHQWRLPCCRSASCLAWARPALMASPELSLPGGGRPTWMEQVAAVLRPRLGLGHASSSSPLHCSQSLAAKATSIHLREPEQPANGWSLPPSVYAFPHECPAPQPMDPHAATYGGLEG